jgi:hypothetical protein
MERNGMVDETVVATITEPELLATDRCDSCGAQALVRVTFLTGMLLFCRHHARKHVTSFLHQAITIYDPNDSVIPDLATGVIKPT